MRAPNERKNVEIVHTVYNETHAQLPRIFHVIYDGHSQNRTTIGICAAPSPLLNQTPTPQLRVRVERTHLRQCYTIAVADAMRTTIAGVLCDR